MRVKRVGFLSLIVLLAVARQAGAQDPPQPQQITFFSNGQRLARVQVSGFLNGINKGIDETGVDGSITIPADALNTVTKGTSVAVWVVTCRDGVITEVIVIREEDGNPNRHDPEHIGEDCRCDKKAVFVWGSGPVTIDVSRGEVSYGDGDADGDGDFAFYGEASFLVKHFYQGDEASGADADDKVDGFGGFLGLRYRNQFAVGGMLEYAPNAEFRNPEAGITGDVDYFFAGLVARYFLSPGRWQPYLQAGYGYARDKGEFARDGMRLEETHETGIANLGAGLRAWVNPNFGFSGAVEYNTVFDESADNSWTYKLGGVFATDRF